MSKDQILEAISNLTVIELKELVDEREWKRVIRRYRS